MKKSKKFILALPAKRIDVVSPTKVAAPSRFENIDIDIITGTGLIFNFLHIVKATGAIIKTVATLSTNALTIPANTAKYIVIHLTFFFLLLTKSAILFGIFESINRLTVPIIPSIINNTLKSILENTLFTGNIPNTTNNTALINATKCFFSEKAKIKA